MTQFKKSFKGIAAALSMATLSMLGVGCDNDNRSSVQKAFDDRAIQVMNHPNRLPSDEIDDRYKGERAVNINRLFESSEWMIEVVQKNPKKFIRNAVEEALCEGRKQGRLIGSRFDVEFLENYTPEPDRNKNTDTEQWIRFFRGAAREAAAIRSAGDDQTSGAIPRTWTGRVLRRDVHGIWRETQFMSPYAREKLAEQKQQTQLVDHRAGRGR